MSTSSSNNLKFAAVFCVYVAYVLFRRLPIAFLAQIRLEIPISNDDIGRIVSIHAAAFTVSKLVFGTAADKTSNSKLFIGGVLMCSTASMCLAFSSTVRQIEIVMTMIGGVQGAAWVPATKLVAMWYDDTSYALMFSVLACASTVAGILLPILQNFYWRTIELNAGLFMIIFALVSKKWVITESDAVRKEVAPVEKRHLEIGVLSVIRSHVVWHIALVSFFSMQMRTICETWVPLYLNEHKVPADGFQLLYEIGGLTGTISTGVLLDKMTARFTVDTSRRLVGVVCSTAMMVAAIGVFRFESHASWLGFVIGFFVNGSINVWCLIGSQAGHRHIAGAVSAFTGFVAALGSIFAGTPLAHLIANFSFDVFIVIFVTQIVFVLSISSLRVPLRMAGSEKKNE